MDDVSLALRRKQWSADDLEGVPLTVHVGQVAVLAALGEWQKVEYRKGDGQTERRVVTVYLPNGSIASSWDLTGVLPAMGALISKVVGVTYYEGLHSPRAGAGWWLRVVREPDNPHSSTAIAVCTDDGVEVGHLPSHITSEIYAGAKLHAADLGALVVTEYRLSDTQERVGIEVLVGPTPVWAEWPRR